jgi:outer membrane protein TolC
MLLIGWAIIVAGCAHPPASVECDWSNVYRQNNIPASLEFDAAAGVIEPLIPPVVNPATVADPERPQWYLSLQEALAIALENGKIGAQSINAPGQVSDDLVVFAGRGVTEPDSVRVLALDPAQVGATIEEALAKFDAVWSSGMSWNTTDQPTQGLSSFQNGAGAAFTTTLAKPLASGGVAGISFGTNYLSLASPPPPGFFSVVNPSYSTSLQVGVEQPLLRGFGTDINQVLPGFPGAILFPSINSRKSANTPEGILVTRLRFDQQRAEFQRNIHFQVMNVESAYWNLYGAYMTLYAAEQGLRQAHVTWMFGKSKVGELIDRGQLALIRAQYEQFRASRMSAMGAVLNYERVLRSLLGLPVADGKRLVPVDAPIMTPYQPSWEAAVRDCLTLRPELVMARQDLQAKELNLKAVKNSLLPDLRAQASYTALGLGTRLDGNGTLLAPDGSLVTNNALRSLTGDHFNNWTIGLNLNVPLGFRYEYANTRISRLQLAQSYQLLKDQEQRAQSALAKQYALVIQNYKLIEIRKMAREAFTEQVEVRSKQYASSTKGATLEFLLDAQRQWAAALSDEFQAVVDYNVALAAFEFARGTILDRNKVMISEGPLPECAQVRAVVHEKERTRAIVLHEQAHPVIYPPLEPGYPEMAPLPNLPANQAPTLPALLTGTPPVPNGLDSPLTVPVESPLRARLGTPLDR